MQKLTIKIEVAPKFIAQLVREGVTFEAKSIASHSSDAEPDYVEIVFTGGY